MGGLPSTPTVLSSPFPITCRFLSSLLPVSRFCWGVEPVRAGFNCFRQVRCFRYPVASPAIVPSIAGQVCFRVPCGLLRKCLKERFASRLAAAPAFSPPILSRAARGGAGGSGGLARCSTGRQRLAGLTPLFRLALSARHGAARRAFWRGVSARHGAARACGAFRLSPCGAGRDSACGGFPRASESPPPVHCGRGTGCRSTRRRRRLSPCGCPRETPLPPA